MIRKIHETICPRCLVKGLRSWTELTPEERMVIERHPATALIPPELRKRHRFCPRCFYVDRVEPRTA